MEKRIREKRGKTKTTTLKGKKHLTRGRPSQKINQMNG
jgi:hypothetical protein